MNNNPTAVELKKVFMRALADRGFISRSTMAKRRTEDVEQIVQFQKSRVSPDYHVNVGLNVLELSDGRTIPEHQCHIRWRAGDVVHGDPSDRLPNHIRYSSSRWLTTIEEAEAGAQRLLRLLDSVQTGDEIRTFIDSTTPPKLVTLSLRRYFGL